VNSANFLFPGKSANGNFSADSVEMLFRQYKQAAGITEPGTVHTLRHSFAAHALENDVDVLCIKQLLGHSCFESTNVYLHVSKTKVYQTPSPADQLNQ
jgi:site-specific recombinase XerD